MKKLVGRTDMEDSLKRLDKLTQEEARMATAQVLKVTHTIEEGVRGVSDKVVGVDDRVSNVNDRVTGVDNKVTTIIEGAQIIFPLSLNKLLNPDWPDVKEAMVVTQQAANDVDEMKRWSSHSCIDFRCVRLNCSYREPITTGHSKMAFPTRPIDQS
jgi:hypothetical protein